MQGQIVSSSTVSISDNAPDFFAHVFQTSLYYVMSLTSVVILRKNRSITCRPRCSSTQTHFVESVKP